MEHVTHPSENRSQIVIGRDLGPAGRAVRVLAGLVFVAAAAASAASTRPSLPWVALSFLAAAAFYTGLVWALGSLLARIDPWLSAILVVLPLAVVSALPFVPEAVGIGGDAYVGVALLVQAAIGYGGCEIVGIPTLLLRRRYTVYCALNGADLVERRLRGGPRWAAWALAFAVFLLVIALGGVAEALGSAAGFFIGYLAFLVIGLAASRLSGSRSGRASVGGPV
jgi:hypothetical protein